MKKYIKLSSFLILSALLLLQGEQTIASYSEEGIAFYAQKNSFGYTSEGIAFYANTAQVSGTLPVYRFVNDMRGDHFYTADENEKDSILNNPQWGFSSEGIAFYANTAQVSGTLPVYRFVNDMRGDHFYTADENEKDSILNNPQWGFSSEGIAFYANTAQVSGTLPVYRFVNDMRGDHFYTADENEKDSIFQAPVYRFMNPENGDHFYTASSSEKAVVLNTSQSGYVPEGIAFYAYTSQINNSSPVYRFNNLFNGDHFYTILESEKDAIINNPTWGYIPEGIAFYASINKDSSTVPIYRFNNTLTGDHFYTASESERYALLNPPLGPEISVGLWNYSRTDIKNSPLQINANKPYNIRDNNGTIIAQIGASSTTKVSYDTDGKLKVYNSISSRLIKSIVSFDATDGDNSTLIFNLNRPNSSYDHYRGKIKVQYYRGPDIVGGNTGSTTSQIWVINTLPLEHYIWGEGETTGTGPMEHTKVMTTIFRTYGFWYIKYANKYAAYGFKIRSDSGSQIYWGYDRETQYPNVKLAAQKTRGIIATYGDDVALTPYSSWSDGRTRSYQEKWGSTEFPWCKSVSDPYGKHATMSTQQLQDAGNHMVGLIANGSLKLAGSENNWAFDRILKYYYTGISLPVNY